MADAAECPQKVQTLASIFHWRTYTVFFMTWPVKRGRSHAIGRLLIVYYGLVILSRYSVRGLTGFYDMLWGCNVALLIAGLGLQSYNNLVVGTAVAVVANPHFAWWVDVISYLMFGFFPVGSAGYLIWPETPYVELMTTTHHVWFIPLLIYLTAGNGGMPWKSILYSIVTTLVLSIICRSLTPKFASLETGQQYYLNINMSHEFWRDVPKEGILNIYHMYDDAHPAVYLLWLNFVAVFTNGPAQLMCIGLAKLFDNSRCCSEGKPSKKTE